MEMLSIWIITAVFDGRKYWSIIMLVTWLFPNVNKLCIENKDYKRYINTAANKRWLRALFSFYCSRHSLRCVTIVLTKEYAQYEYEYESMYKIQVISISLQLFYNLISLKNSICINSVIVRIGIIEITTQSYRELETNCVCILKMYVSKNFNWS